MQRCRNLLTLQNYVLWDSQRKQPDIPCALQGRKWVREHSWHPIFCLPDHSFIFFGVCVFPSHICTSPQALSFLSPEAVFPRNVLVPHYPNPRAHVASCLAQQLHKISSIICLVLPDNPFYSRQSSSLQLSLLILLNCRVPFFLAPSLERRGGNVSVNVSILHERWNDISIQYIQTCFKLSPQCGVLANSEFCLLLINWWTRDDSSSLLI